MPWFFMCSRDLRGVAEPVVRQEARRQTNAVPRINANVPAPPSRASTDAQEARSPRIAARPAIPLLTVSEQAFSAMSNSQKTQWLVASAQRIRDDENCMQQHIIVGDRKLSGREAVTFALELASQFNRRQVPAIARRLLEDYPNPHFYFFGVRFESTRLEGWAREGIQSASEVEVTPQVQDLGKLLYENNSQNVHAGEAKAAQVAQLQRIKQRVVPGLCISTSSAEKEIHDYLTASAANIEQAQRGFNKVKALTDGVAGFNNQSPRDCLTLVWNYIRQISDDQLKADLGSALKTRFNELGREQICALGTIERMIDVPTGIDWSITAKISTEHLREELRTLAGTVNNGFEDEIKDYMRTVRDAVGTSEVTGNPEAIFTSMKRDRFLATADIEYGILRKLDRAVVATQAKHVFPADIVL